MKSVKIVGYETYQTRKTRRRRTSHIVGRSGNVFCRTVHDIIIITRIALRVLSRSTKNGPSDRSRKTCRKTLRPLRRSERRVSQTDTSCPRTPGAVARRRRTTPAADPPESRFSDASERRRNRRRTVGETGSPDTVLLVRRRHSGKRFGQSLLGRSAPARAVGVCVPVREKGGRRVGYESCIRVSSGARRTRRGSWNRTDGRGDRRGAHGPYARASVRRARRVAFERDSRAAGRVKSARGY